MRLLWIAALVCAGAVLVLALAPPGALVPGRDAARGPDNRLNDSYGSAADNILLPHDGQGSLNGTALFGKEGNKSALFSKFVTEGTRYIVISLYSGDTSDPISVTVIAPDRTLGPYYDGSDGVVDGRIDLKISTRGNLTTGAWKFLVHSNKNIAYGSLANLSWIRTGDDRPQG
jgi:hypothetical protein